MLMEGMFILYTRNNVLLDFVLYRYVHIPLYLSCCSFGRKLIKVGIVYARNIVTLLIYSIHTLHFVVFRQNVLPTTLFVEIAGMQVI